MFSTCDIERMPKMRRCHLCETLSIPTVTQRCKPSIADPAGDRSLGQDDGVMATSRVRRVMVQDWVLYLHGVHGVVALGGCHPHALAGRGP